eukprot:2574347-Rhodomonas_salina.1
MEAVGLGQRLAGQDWALQTRAYCARSGHYEHVVAGVVRGERRQVADLVLGADGGDEVHVGVEP